MFTTIRKNKTINRTRRFGLLESLENRALMTADAVPFSEAAEESNIEPDPQVEVQSFDTDSEMAVNVAGVQIGQTDADRELTLDEIAIIAQLKYLRDVLAGEELAGIAEIESFDDFIPSIDDVLNSLRDGSDIGSIMDSDSGDGYADPINLATGGINSDGPDFVWSSRFASDGKEPTTDQPKEVVDDPDNPAARNPTSSVGEDGSVETTTRRTDGSVVTHTIFGNEDRVHFVWIRTNPDGSRAQFHTAIENDGSVERDMSYFEPGTVHLPDPDGGGISPLDEWLLGRLDVKLPGELDSRSDLSLSSPNQVYPGPDDALADPLTTDMQPPLDYEDIAGQPDPYEANPQNGSLDKVRPISEADLSPDPGPINPGIGSIGGG